MACRLMAPNHNLNQFDFSLPRFCVIRTILQPGGGNILCGRHYQRSVPYLTCPRISPDIDISVWSYPYVIKILRFPYLFYFTYLIDVQLYYNNSPETSTTTGNYCSFCVSAWHNIHSAEQCGSYFGIYGASIWVLGEKHDRQISKVPGTDLRTPYFLVLCY